MCYRVVPLKPTRGGPLVVQASPARWVFWKPICSSAPAGVVVRGCAWLQWIFFLKARSTCLPISWWVIYESPAHIALSAQGFWPKTAWPLCPTLPIYLISSPGTFFCFPNEKSPQRERFCWCGRGETKDARSTKRHQYWQVQTVLSSGKKRLNSYIALHQMESTFKVTEI